MHPKPQQEAPKQEISATTTRITFISNQEIECTSVKSRKAKKRSAQG
jgi:hypothetical protein